MDIKSIYNNFKDYDKLARNRYGTYYDDLIYDGKNYNGSVMEVVKFDHECVCCGAPHSGYGLFTNNHEPGCDFANGWENSAYAKNRGEIVRYDLLHEYMYPKNENSYSLIISRAGNNYLQAYKNKEVVNKRINHKIMVKTALITGVSFITLMLINLIFFQSFIFFAILIGGEFALAFAAMNWYKVIYREEEYGVGTDYYGITTKNITNDKYDLLISDKESAEDIAKEYNEAISTGNINILTHIMNNLNKSNAEWKNHSHNMMINYTNKLNNDSIKRNIQIVERYKGNPVLNGLPLSDSANAKNIVLTADKIVSLESYLGEGDLASVKSLIERFNVMEGERDNLNGFDLAKLDNCWAEFYVHYNKLLVKVSSGDNITGDEVNNFMNVVDSCSVVLSVISPKLVEGRMDKLRVSNMFLKDKYNLA